MALNGSFLTNGYNTGRDTVYLEFIWTGAVRYIEENKTALFWELRGNRTASGYVNAGGFKVVIDGETVYSKSTDYRIALYNDTLVASGSKMITHNSDGNRSVEVYIQGGVYTYAVNCTGKATLVLDQIPRASSLSVANGTLDKSQNLTVTKQASSFTHTITYKSGTASGTICTKDSRTSIPWTPPLDLASQSTQSQYVPITYTITTYSGNTSVGSKSVNAKCYIPDNIGPYFYITSSDPTGLADIYEEYIQGQSKLKLEIDAYGSYGSWIKSYKITFDGKTYTEKSFVSDVISQSGFITANIEIVDSRERLVKGSKTIDVHEYKKPKIESLVATRCDENGNASDDGLFVAVRFSATYTYDPELLPVPTYSLQVKKTAETQYSYIDRGIPMDEPNFNGLVIFEADPSSSYDIILNITDDIAPTPVERATTAPSASKVFSFKKAGGKIVAMALGKIAELNDVFDIAFQTRFLGGILHPVLPTNRDLDNEKTPKTYMLLSANNYINAPETGIGMFLEIVGQKDASIIQRISVFDTANRREYERIHYATTGWGDWICTRGDFVIEQGVLNGWTYRKWNSGTGECWKSLTHNTEVNNLWGSIYISPTAVERQSYPFPFIGKPVENMTVQGNKPVMVILASGGNGVNGAYQSARYHLCSPGSHDSADYYLSYYCIGKWK